MRARRSFLPSVQQVEDRVVLSFSLGGFLNSMFPGIDPQHTSKPAAHATTSSTGASATKPASPAHAHTHAQHPTHAPVHPHSTPLVRHPARALTGG